MQVLFRGPGDMERERDLSGPLSQWLGMLRWRASHCTREPSAWRMAGAAQRTVVSTDPGTARRVG
jgi:hypothetical protein